MYAIRSYYGLGADQRIDADAVDKAGVRPLAFHNQRRRLHAVEQAGMQAVITSYSIHYTKLYEVGGHRHVAKQYAGVDGEVVDALLGLFDQRVAEDFPGQLFRLAVYLLQRLIRITSYNVCYTKLLRETR